MKQTIFLSLMAILLSLAACESDKWDDLPQPIANFVSQYYPGAGVKSYNHEENYQYRVEVSTGAVIIFDSEMQWISVDGRGVVLPEVMIYDQTPPELFSFLQATGQQEEVYAMKRDKKFYKLTMHDTVLTYNIQTGAVTYPGQAPDPTPD